VLQYLTKKNLVKDKQLTFKQSIVKSWHKFRSWINIHDEHEENHPQEKGSPHDVEKTAS
jgi:hypothetical protein